MKRTFTIEVEVSDEVIRGTSSAQRIDSDKYLVQVEPTEGHPDYICAAHELGHIIGLHFRLPRTSRFMLNLPTYGASIVNCEHEAWDMAEIALRVRDARQHFISTYERVFGPQLVAPVFYPYNK